MPPRRGTCTCGRGDGGAGRTQPGEQPAVQVVNLTALVTQADLVAMEQRKYNPKTFDGSLEDPTMAQIWLTSVETIFRYMKCPNNQKVQRAVFFLTDRGTVCLRYAKPQEFLNLEQGDMTVEQYDTEFDMLSHFVLEPTTHADALCLTVDMSLHERVDPFKAVGKGSTPGQKRKAELQPTIVPQKNLRSVVFFSGIVRRLCSREGLERLPACRSCGRSHGGCYLEGSGGRVFATTRQEVEQVDIVVTGMDWLSTNHASIDYSLKEVVFNPHSTVSFKYKGAGTMVLPKAILAMKASKLLNQGLPPSRKTPISRAPYRVVPTELKELKIWALQVHCNVFWLDKCSCCIYGSDEQEVGHEEHLHQVLETLRANKLYAKFSKCYYKRFMEDFSRIASPLNQLTRTGTHFVWSPTCESSFQDLKVRWLLLPLVKSHKQNYPTYDLELE
ncbi:gag-protease polyprotein [Cucumis melo var. makuwa]|uniref:Gag-protease polyprotein n=1 Tax=Cucumis melo var. makuwa TaxID=1194695 RepID=A0A5D3C087_CUCMM|nr:gag-protease polyprotein [Cucumis melo var. makuwa]TYK05383.1 gag-protease polyprotein [Cucumis melo var. makuwa]